MAATYAQRSNSQRNAVLNTLVSELADNARADKEMLGHALEAVKVLADLENQQKAAKAPGLRHLVQDDDEFLDATSRKNDSLRNFLLRRSTGQDRAAAGGANTSPACIDHPLSNGATDPIVEAGRRKFQHALGGSQVARSLQSASQPGDSEDDFVPFVKPRPTAPPNSKLSCKWARALPAKPPEDLDPLDVLKITSTKNNDLREMLALRPQPSTSPVSNDKPSIPPVSKETGDGFDCADLLARVRGKNTSFKKSLEEAQKQPLGATHLPASSKEDVARLASSNPELLSQELDREIESAKQFQLLVANLRSRLTEIQATDFDRKVDINALYSDDELRLRLSAAELTVAALQSQRLEVASSAGAEGNEANARGEIAAPLTGSDGNEVHGGRGDTAAPLPGIEWDEANARGETAAPMAAAEGYEANAGEENAAPLAAAEGNDANAGGETAEADGDMMLM